MYRSQPTQNNCFHRESADQVADILLSPHRRHGLVPRLREKSSLSSYLEDVFCVNARAAHYFVQRLIHGLIDEEGNSIKWRQKINDRGDETSLLCLACQWKQFEKEFGWKGKSEMVKIILAHPKIDVNECMPNGCNTAFFTLKYGDADTLRYVIEAGCDLSKRDVFGQTLLKNAVEYPDPDTLRLLLEHISPFDTFPMTHQISRKITRYTAVDDILLLYSGLINPVSWRIYGCPPPVEKTAECLIMLRQRGVKVTFDPIMAHFKALSLCFESISEAKRNNIVAAEDFKKLGECLLGLWFPPAIQSEINNKEILPCDLKDETFHTPSHCVLCDEQYLKPTRLYCGHSFCRECIIDYGSKSVMCPICSRKLCLDVAPFRDKQMGLYNEIYSNDGNVEQNWKDRNTIMMKGVESLSNEQVLAEISECGDSGMTHDGLIQRILSGHRSFLQTGSQANPMLLTGGQNAGDTVQVGGPFLEMTATHTICSEQHLLVSPSLGPVWIEIVVKGIPVLASVSNNSRYTIVSPKFRETFNLKQIKNLTTSKMRCGLSGNKLGHSTCLEEFSFTIGSTNTEIKLRNAIETATPNESRGIQLGQDFFLSGRYCIASVLGLETSDGKPVYLAADGTSSWIDMSQTSESLRYYSHSGDIVKLHLIHFKPLFHGAQVRVVTLKENSTFRECNYCCRTFPQWKHSKCCDDVDYCDERCQKASRKIHKIRKPMCGLDRN